MEIKRKQDDLAEILEEIKSRLFVTASASTDVYDWKQLGLPFSNIGLLQAFDERIGNDVAVSAALVSNNFICRNSGKKVHEMGKYFSTESCCLNLLRFLGCPVPAARP